MKIRDLPVCRNELFEAIRTAVNRQNDAWDALNQIERLCHSELCVGAFTEVMATSGPLSSGDEEKTLDMFYRWFGDREVEENLP